MYPSISLPAVWDRLNRLPGEVVGLVEGLACKPRDWWLRSFPYPLINVHEEADEFHVEAEVPGVAVDHIDLHIRNGTELTLQGERPCASSESGTWLYQERGVGKFLRVLRFPVPVDADKVQARLEHGVLRIILPKTEAVKAHRIAVQGANSGTGQTSGSAV